MSKVNSAIAFSDIHLGREKNYLYFADGGYQKNKDAIIEFLNELGPQDELILNGDILELSLAGWDEIYKDLINFFAIISETGPYSRIVYIPGNHDHHFWRNLAEQVHIYGKIKNNEEPPGHYKYCSCFVDERFSSNNPKITYEILFTHFWPQDKKKPEFVVKYPHHLVKIQNGNGSVKNYLITHGHFLEKLFKPANYLIDPAHLEELEAFNNIWLEAFDYHIGHAGRFSSKARELASGYEKGGKEAKQKVKKALDELYKNMKNKIGFKWPKTWIIKFGLRVLAKKVPMERKSGLYKEPLNDELKITISDYIEKYILQRYQKGKSEEYFFPADSDIPKPFTFVFGHTHRPIKHPDTEYASIQLNGNNYPILNTGGWLKDDGTKPDGENAGVLLINQNGAEWKSLKGKLQ